MRKKFCILSLALVLGGCTDNGFLFRSGDYETTDQKGMYIIGEPYAVKGTFYTPKEDFNYVETGMAAWYVPREFSSNGEAFSSTNGLTARHKTLPLPTLVRVTNLENGNTAIVRVNDRGPYVNNRLIDVSKKAAEALEFPANGTVMVKVEVLAEPSQRLKAELAREGLVAPPDWGTGEKVIPEETTSDILYQPAAAVAPPIIYGEVSDDAQSDSESLTVVTRPIVAEESDEPKGVSVTPAIAAQPIYGEELVQKGSQSHMMPLVEGWYVQLGAFGVEANARRLESQLSNSYPVVVFPQKRGDRVLNFVRVGPFDTQGKAIECLDKLKKAGYADARVILEQ